MARRRIKADIGWAAVRAVQTAPDSVAADLATNLATTTAQFASTPESAIICAVSCTWHSISGTLLAGAFALKDKMAAKKAEEAAETKTA